MSAHLHLTDKSGAGLLVEGTPNSSFALYDTRECWSGEDWDSRMHLHAHCLLMAHLRAAA